MERVKLSQLQGSRLQELIGRVYEKVPFYKKRMDEAGVKPADISGIEDIKKLPFTSKVDMREVYPYGLLAVPEEELVEIHTSSGTTGSPVVDAYTLNDIELWMEVMGRTLTAAGVTKKDTVQNAYGYGLFTGGLGVHYGSRKIGANVIPISGGNTQRQLQIMQDFKTNAITCTPSYSLFLAEEGRKAGMDFASLPLRVGLLGAEPWSDAMRKDIEEKLSISAFDIYGLTEIIGPGVSAECEHKDGLHIFEDVFYPEIINPATGEVLPDGERGELVITTLTKEGTPVIRFRTRDITYLIREKCGCGRTMVRMHRSLGRTDDMLIIRGVNVFPSQIEEVLMNIEGVEPHYQIVVDRKGQLDSIEVHVEMNDKLFSDEIKNLENAEKKIEEKLYSVLNIHTIVKLVETSSLQRFMGKAQRVIDRRQI